MLDELEHELERVRAHRADVPEPDDASVAAARSELMQAIASTPGPTRSRTRLRRLQRRRRFVLAGGLATMGVGVAGVLGFTTAATPMSALAAQMNQLAKVAANQDWSGIPGPGQYLYTESNGLTSSGTYDNGKSCSVTQIEHRKIWIATDGSGALSDTRDQSTFTSTADQASCAAMGITDPSSQNSSGSYRYAAGGLTFPTNDWKSLSTAPAMLLKQVHQRDGGPDTPAEWFVNVTDFMRESDVPPAIRAALYQAAALIPGVKLLGTETDPDGQTGLAVGFPYPSGQIHAEMIFDQQTGRMLAEEYYDPTGTLEGWYCYTAQAIVDSTPSYPMDQPGPPLRSSGASTNTTSTTSGATTTSVGSGTTTSAPPAAATTTTG